MDSFLERFRKNAHWLVFILLELISGILLFNYNRYQNSVWVTSANTVSGKVLEWEAEVYSYLQLKDINKGLVQENTLLQANIAKLRTDLLKEGIDTTDIEAKLHAPLEGLQLIPAKVISNSVSKLNNFITLDKGSLDGVQPEMGVVCGTGVVGIVYKVSPHYCLVTPVLNGHSNISCRLRGSKYFGYLRWYGGSSLDAFLEEIPLHAQFQRGDEVETSGFSSVFPPGIFVGRVEGSLRSNDGLAYRIQVRLSVDLSLVRDVLIISNPNGLEIDTLESKVIDLEKEAIDRKRVLDEQLKLENQKKEAEAQAEAAKAAKEGLKSKNSSKSTKSEKSASNEDESGASTSGESDSNTSGQASETSPSETSPTSPPPSTPQE